jgi:hypothetical protein
VAVIRRPFDRLLTLKDAAFKPKFPALPPGRRGTRFCCCN